MCSVRTAPSQTGIELDELFAARDRFMQERREGDGETFAAEIGATVTCTICGTTISASAMLACSRCAN